MRRAALLLALTLPVTAWGQARQYRQLELTDGREMRAEVLETRPTGLLMEVPQGTTLISFELLMDMVPIDAEQYRDQPPARVWLRGGESQEALEAIYGEVKALQVVTSDDPQGLPPGVVLALEACDLDFSCMSEALTGQPWMWLVTASPPSDDTNAAVVVRGRTSAGPPIHRANSTSDSAADLWNAAHEVIGLVEQGDVPKAVLSALGEQNVTTVPTPDPNPDLGLGWTKNRVYSSSFVPLPGYTALRQRDTTGFLTGLGVGLGGTAVVFTASLLATDGKPSDVGLATAGGFYIMSVAVNRWVGMRAYDKNKASSVGFDFGTTEHGAHVGLRGRLR